ncbi:MAG: hypothetical protein ACLFP2_00110 [Candidatus Woesearchaeota archaeon]
MLSEIQATIDTLKKQGIRLSAPVLVDLVGLIIFIFVNSIYIKKIVAALTSFNVHVSRNMEAIMGDLLTTKDIFSIMSKYPLIANDLSTVFFLTFLMFVSCFIIYCVFQSVSWFFAYRFTGHKVSLSRFMLRFSVVNIPWVLLLLLGSFISLIFDIRAALSTSPVSFNNIFTSILMFFLVYIALVSYTRLDKKNPFKALKSIARKRLFLGYVGGFALFFGTVFLFSLVPIHAIQLILEVLFLLPLLTGLRVFFLKLSKN